MCGRFYVDDEMINEINKIFKNIDNEKVKKGEVYPTDKAIVIKKEISETKPVQVALNWGYKIDDKKRVIFNSRSETVMDKVLFRKDFSERRCVVPVKGFYEWNTSKEKFFYKSKEKDIIYLAGIYRILKDEKQFTIITTDASDKLKDIHQRVPLIINEENINFWLDSEKEAACLLKEKYKSFVAIKEEK